MKMNSLRNPSESEYTEPLVCSERLCRPYTWLERCNTQPFSGRISNSNVWIWAYTFLTLSPVEKRLRLCSVAGSLRRPNLAVKRRWTSNSDYNCDHDVLCFALSCCLTRYFALLLRRRTIVRLDDHPRITLFWLLRHRRPTSAETRVRRL